MGESRQVYGWQSMKRSSFDKEFHTFTLEWTDRFMRMYVDKRVRAMLEVDHLDEEKSKSRARGGFWARGTSWFLFDLSVQASCSRAAPLVVPEPS